VDFTVSEADLTRDSLWASRILAAYGISRGNHILVTARESDTPWIDPFRVGAGLLKAVHSNAEIWGWDARRTDMFIRRLNVDVIVGLSCETVVSLGQIDSAIARLRAVPHILARRAAREALQNASISAGEYLPLGPAIAVSAPDGENAMLCYDENEWAVESIDGQLVVSTVGPRATKFDRQVTGVAGQTHRTSEGMRISVA
jgi:hypothetical protein